MGERFPTRYAMTKTSNRRERTRNYPQRLVNKIIDKWEFGVLA